MGNTKAIPFNHAATHQAGGTDPINGIGGAVSSVFGRVGAVVAQAGDYTAAQVSAVAQATLTANEDILIRRAGVPAALAVGAEGQVPKVVGGVVTWSTLSALFAVVIYSDAVTVVDTTTTPALQATSNGTIGGP